MTTNGGASMETKQFFSRSILAWFDQNHRPLPWKGEKDPYKIWLSEIILQQTRVEQGLPYYHKFIERYPNVRHLADAPEDEVLKLWEGLGYYARARNLHTTAKYIAGELDGKFPDTYQTIRKLKGIGDYTAAAIASFAYNLPYAALDGNVFRVLSRYFGIATPAGTAAAKNEFQLLARQLLDPARPGDFNQATMDFGATHCTPKQPRCSSCPLSTHCMAFRQGKVSEFPAKTKAPARKNRYFIYLVADLKGDTLIQKRKKKDIWQDLYEFPSLEQETLPPDNKSVLEKLTGHFFPEGLPSDTRIIALSNPFRQILTHQIVTAVFCEMAFAHDSSRDIFSRHPFGECRWVSVPDLKKNIAFPRIIDLYLKKKALTLRLI